VCNTFGFSLEDCQELSRRAAAASLLPNDQKAKLLEAMA
jgi:hypothetical protein